jgi:HAMP domain-containing protein
MNNKGLLIVIALVLVGILGVLAMQYQERQKSPIERVGDSVSETVEEVGDEIDDHTDAK